MYCGQVVENGTVEELFEQPLHPYTEGLLESIPVIDGDIQPLTAIKGMFLRQISFQPAAALLLDVRK